MLTLLRAVDCVMLSLSVGHHSNICCSRRSGAVLYYSCILCSVTALTGLKCYETDLNILVQCYNYVPVSVTALTGSQCYGVAQSTVLDLQSVQCYTTNGGGTLLWVHTLQ